MSEQSKSSLPLAVGFLDRAGILGLRTASVEHCRAIGGLASDLSTTSDWAEEERARPQRRSLRVNELCLLRICLLPSKPGAVLGVQSSLSLAGRNLEALPRVLSERVGGLSTLSLSRNRFALTRCPRASPWTMA